MPVTLGSGGRFRSSRSPQLHSEFGASLKKACLERLPVWTRLRKVSRRKGFAGRRRGYPSVTHTRRLKNAWNVGCELKHWAPSRIVVWKGQKVWSSLLLDERAPLLKAACPSGQLGNNPDSAFPEGNMKLVRRPVLSHFMGFWGIHCKTPVRGWTGFVNCESGCSQCVNNKPQPCYSPGKLHV